MSEEKLELLMTVSQMESELKAALHPNSFHAEDFLGDIDIVLNIIGHGRYGIIGSGPTYEDALRHALLSKPRKWRDVRK
jgi:hypothetical protein